MHDIVRAFLLLSACLSMTACGFLDSRRNDTFITPSSLANNKRGDWFCQVNNAWNGWECAQDPGLMMKPVPARPPQPPQPESATIAAEQLHDAVALSGTDPLPVIADRSDTELASHEVRTPAPAPQPVFAPVPEQFQHSAALPAWQGVAYRPTETSDLSDLPADFYAVQIVAMSSLELLESFAIEHQLSGALAVRSKVDGEYYHVLLLGIYETLADAQAAAASRPGSLMNIEPWIRKLGSLQKAVIRTDELANPAAIKDSGK